MVGFGFFMFEGIGSLLPLMRETAEPEKMPQITLVVLACLGTIYATFAFLCYYAWGSDLTESVVTEMLPAGNTWVQIMKMLFCVNLVISYPLTIIPTFNALEAFFLGVAETNTDDEEILDDHGNAPQGVETLT
jgi:amino acid permease